MHFKYIIDFILISEYSFFLTEIRNIQGAKELCQEVAGRKLMAIDTMAEGNFVRKTIRGIFSSAASKLKVAAAFNNAQPRPGFWYATYLGGCRSLNFFRVGWYAVGLSSSTVCTYERLRVCERQVEESKYT